MTQHTSLRWEGITLWTTGGRAAAEQGLDLALQHLLTQSQRIVPLDKGPLERSGRTNREGLNGVVSFDTAYAVVQHERLDFRHAPGRSAKFLEIPFNSERDVMLRLMSGPLIDFFSQ